MTHPATINQTTPTHKPLEIVHLVCCLNIDRAFCGQDRGGAPFTDRDADCIVCIDIRDTNAGCPNGHHCTDEPHP